MTASERPVYAPGRRLGQASFAAVVMRRLAPRRRRHAGGSEAAPSQQPAAQEALANLLGDYG